MLVTLLKVWSYKLYIKKESVVVEKIKEVELRSRGEQIYL